MATHLLINPSTYSMYIYLMFMYFQMVLFHKSIKGFDVLYLRKWMPSQEALGAKSWVSFAHFSFSSAQEKERRKNIFFKRTSKECMNDIRKAKYDFRHQALAFPKKNSGGSSIFILCQLLQSSSIALFNQSVGYFSFTFCRQNWQCQNWEQVCCRKSSLIEI